MKHKHSSNIAFIDLLFNTLLGFVILFFLAFLLINPIAKSDDMPVRAEFLIMVEWPGQDRNDIDIWVSGPGDVIIGFQNKTSEFMHLDRDDLGINNITYIDNIPMHPETSRELVTIRGIVPGDYFLNLHAFYVRTVPSNVTITVMDLHPVKEVYKDTIQIVENKEIVVLPGFTVNSEGNVDRVFNNSNIFLPFRHQ